MNKSAKICIKRNMFMFVKKTFFLNIVDTQTMQFKKRHIRIFFKV